MLYISYGNLLIDANLSLTIDIEVWRKQSIIHGKRLIKCFDIKIDNPIKALVDLVKADPLKFNWKLEIDLWPGLEGNWKLLMASTEPSVDPLSTTIISFLKSDPSFSIDLIHTSVNFFVLKLTITIDKSIILICENPY